MTKQPAGPPAGQTEAEEADWWYEHRDETDELFAGPEVPITVRRDVTISVRFSAEELAAVRGRADDAGMKPTAYIRQAALVSGDQAADTKALAEAVAALTADLSAMTRDLHELQRRMRPGAAPARKAAKSARKTPARKAAKSARKTPAKAAITVAKMPKVRKAAVRAAKQARAVKGKGGVGSAASRRKV